MALATTTLGAAVGASALTVPLAAVTSVAVGQWLYADSEALAVDSLTGLWATVRRGVGGTSVSAHASGATVTIGSPSQFYDTDPVGVPASPVLVTPWINLLNGRSWVVSGSTWVVQTAGGVAAGDVVGPASATSGDIASFSGTTGKLVADGAKTAASLVVGPSSATDNAVARFDATSGTLVQNSAVTIADTTGDLVTAGDVRAATYHVGATAGANGGTFTAITSITVSKGIVTAISGT